MNAKELAIRMADQTETICHLLLPKGKQLGNYIVAGNVSGSEGDSLKVNLTGSKRGMWKDYATDEHGDLLNLWASTKNISVGEAMSEVHKYLGISVPQYIRPTRQKKVEVEAVPKKTAPSKDCLEWIESRGISCKTVKDYGFYCSGKYLITPCYEGDKLRWWKGREIGKKAFISNKEPDYCLIGKSVVKPLAREIVITEGEFDAMSYYEQGIPAVSVPSGASNLKWIENDFEWLERFDIIYLSFDMDEAGKTACRQIAKRLGYHRCRIVELPEKDANECLVQRLNLIEYVQASNTIDPESLKNAMAYYDDVHAIFNGDMATAGLPTMFTEKIGRNLMFRGGEVTVWSGLNGSGKSMLLGQLSLWGIQLDYRWCIASMEMPPKRTLHRMVIQSSVNPEPNKKEIDEALQYMSKGLWLFTEQGTTKAERVIEVMKYAAMRYDVNQFIIDSLAKCGFDEDDYNGQKRFIDKITEFAKELNVHVHIVCHLRKPNTSNGELPSKSDVRGGSALTDMVDNVMIIVRNKEKEKEVFEAELINAEPRAEISMEPDAYLLCEKQRNYSWEKRIGIFYNVKTQQFSDIQYRKMMVRYEEE